MIHLVPQNDSIHHEPDNCPCNPRITGSLTTHTAQDGWERDISDWRVAKMPNLNAPVQELDIIQVN